MSRSSWLFNDLIHLWLFTWYILDLHVDFKVFDARDLAVITIFHLTSTDDLDNQGQNYLLWPLAHHGLYTWYRLNLGVDLNISDSGNLKMTNICHLTSIVDLANQGQTYFQMAFIISGSIHATYLILVLILTIEVKELKKSEIYNVAMMVDIKNDMNFKKIGFTLKIKVNNQGQVTEMDFLRSSTLKMLESTPRLGQYSMHTAGDKQGHRKNVYVLEFQDQTFEIRELFQHFRYPRPRKC